jgi:hypothetical protein
MQVLKRTQYQGPKLVCSKVDIEPTCIATNVVHINVNKNIYDM